MRPRRVPWATLVSAGVLAVAAASGCARGTGAARSAEDGPRPIRFAIELRDETTGPIFVTLGASDGGPGWVWAIRDGRRVYLHERCEIGDCGKERAVCGAPVPLLRDLAAGGERRVEFLWDGMISVVDSAAGGCEIRRPAPLGSYVASLCYSRRAAIQGQPSPSGVVQGRLAQPTCVERRFTTSDREVVLRI